MSESRPIPFSKRIPLDWGSILTAVGWIATLALAAAGYYLRDQFATHAEVQSAVAPFSSVPMRVDRLEEFRVRQELAQQHDDEHYNTISVDLASLKTSHADTAKKIDRILDYLEAQRKARD